ncbi:MAG TPA: PQQ-dependent sugar dehydrogenase [Gaiellaceae bacterium]|nr:PQQ-dependent sugar dehydrogenase [Gaiellaceae bacterium]
MRGLAAVVGVAALLTLACGAGAGEQRTGALRIVKVVDGLASPVHAAAPRSEPGRLYVVEQAGRIVVVEGGRAVRTFLDIRNQVRSGGEQGLLSVAFHPNYAQNRRFYVDYTDLRGDTRVVEYRSDGTQAIPSTRRQLLHIDQPYPNHNGGQLVFAPNGLLYIGMGDGGSGGDPENRAQNPRSLLGKLLTLNVDVPGARPRIAALGTRNPWRISFDRKNGDLYMGDVGQNAWEEIDYRPHAKLGRLANYGWDIYEGRASYEPKRLGPGELVRPIYVYGHGGNNCSVTGGFVYRGSAVPAARGRYFFGDWCSGLVWSLRVSGGRAVDDRREPFRVPSLSSFGEDARGELYLVSQAGAVYRLAG